MSEPLIGRSRPREARLVAEYVAATFPLDRGWTIRQRVPLGPATEQATAAFGPVKGLRASRPYRPEVDAVAHRPTEVVMVEGKIFKVIDGLAKLPIYKDLWPSTPEAREMKNWPVEMRLVAPRTAPWFEEAARAKNITVVVYRPDWVDEYELEYQKYWTKEYRESRRLAGRFR